MCYIVKNIYSNYNLSKLLQNEFYYFVIINVKLIITICNWCRDTHNIVNIEKDAYLGLIKKTSFGEIA